MSLFNKIAPIYGMFFNFQLRYFNKIQEKVGNEIDFSKYDSILDIGCGTGALCKVFHDKGLEVVGVDPSKGMLAQANKKLNNLPIKLIHIVPGEPLPFKDKSFDIVITSYVAHGLKKDERLQLYNEMKRLSKKLVIIHDYNENRAILTSIVEWLENGDYFNFIKIAEEEMKEVFNEVKKIDVDTRAAWYICYCKE